MHLGIGAMRRIYMLAAYATLLASSSGCNPWDLIPCLGLRCGDTCTLCAHDDFACIWWERPHLCNADGSCELAPDPSNPLDPALCRAH